MMRRSLVTELLVATIGFAAAIAVASCADKKPTEIMIALSTETSIPKGIDRMELEVLGGGQEPRLWTIYKLPEQAKLPGTMAVVAAKQTDPSDPIQVNVYAYLGGSRRFVRRATLGFSVEKTKLLRMPVRLSCVDFPEVCPDGETCVAGECKSAAVSPDTLLDFDSSQVFGVVGDGHCFDPKSCLAGGTDITATLLATSDCTVTMAAASTGKLNVGMVWVAGGETAVPLDVDPVEGFTMDATKGTATLAEGICHSLKIGRAVQVFASTSCASKGIDIPICDGPPSLDLDAGTVPDASASDAGDAGNDAADAGPSQCALSLPGDACDPTRQTGCPAGQACRVTGTSTAGFRLACTTGTFKSSAAVGATCQTSSDCAGNMTCYQSTCQPYCCEDAQCCNGGSCPAACSVVQDDLAGNEVRSCKPPVMTVLDGG